MPKKEYSAPLLHGDKLIEPTLDRLTELWHGQLKSRIYDSSMAIDQTDLATLQAIAREELVQTACEYSGQYLDCVDPLFAERTSKPIMMAGHQPTLFHPGVWLKNFFLFQQSQRFSALPINLIIDNDLCDSRILIPTGSGIPDRIEEFELAGTNSNCPFEGAQVTDLEDFYSAGSKIEQRIKPLVFHPTIRELWPEVIRASQQLKHGEQLNLGQAIAAGRHRLEAKLGLKTLEVPISSLARTRSFAQFAWHMLAAADRFQLIHNEGVLEYRRQYNLRSRTHPFPQLDQRGDWYETPFWIFLDSATKRKPLFVRQWNGELQLSDFAGWQLNGLKNSADLFQRISDQSLLLRPRAVTTTLYSRLILSDLFVHGIGGGKYDQVTDWIASRFWQIRLPDYCVVSATYQLFPNLSSVSPAQIGIQKQQLRELEMNPDKFLLSNETTEVPAEVRAAIDRKRALIRERPAAEGADERSGMGKMRHLAIAQCNSILKKWTEPLKAELMSKLAQDEQRLQQALVFGSREFSFCLHPIELTAQLIKC
jgi:hypothetical protein